LNKLRAILTSEGPKSISW